MAGIGGGGGASAGGQKKLSEKEKKEKEKKNKKCQFVHIFWGGSQNLCKVGAELWITGIIGK